MCFNSERGTRRDPQWHSSRFNLKLHQRQKASGISTAFCILKSKLRNTAPSASAIAANFSAIPVSIAGYQPDA
ncbi:hypothetical protein CEXT_460971 [Caerostris extrusa]|uniref:Uncharacterized protein n=1 Tax=Caerostris extrusa TaxID=172846 RepID=A0AAV4MWF6_CAEEX|nr:hypothetical protein CEXT_460971 [Caerostris extrusa]